MKTEITAFDLHFLVRELQALVGQRLDKIYILDERNILLTFGNKQLLQAAPGQCWMPLQRPETPEQIHPFAAQLRKLIGNSKIIKIEQVCSERILSIHTERSSKQFVLYLEIFARGNAVICSGNNLVINALAINQRVQRGKPYQLPDSIDTFHLSEQDFALRFAQSTDNVSKTLAVQFGLGKVLAEELCVRTGVPATDKATPEHAQDVYPVLKLLLAQQLKPQLIYEDGRLVDATPISLQCYANKKRENTEGFGASLARVFALPAEAVKEHKLSPVTQKLKKIETMISLQQKRLAELERQAAAEHKKGEYLYEHYQDIKKLLDEIKAAKEKLSWKEVKEKIKQMREIDEATGNVVVDV
jgi:predicted ribosome quality control (RQC) complex YloA/Tae2 family protein